MKSGNSKIGLALGGGGARGLAHIGVIKVLESNGIPIDVICGTSMGALIGAMYASDPNIQRLENKIKEYFAQNDVGGSWLDFLSKQPEEFKGNFLLEMSYYVRKKYMELVAMSKISLEAKEILEDALNNLLEDKEISALKIPFAAAAIDLTDGKDVLFRSGSLFDAVYASSSIEGVFPPLEKDGKMYSDGGPTTNVPAEACRELGADFIIAVYIPLVLRREENFANGLEVMLRADNIATTKLGGLLLRDADVAILPKVNEVHWAAFQKIDEAIKLGVDAAEKVLPQIYAGIKGRSAITGRLKRYLKMMLED